MLPNRVNISSFLDDTLRQIRRDGKFAVQPLSDEAAPVSHDALGVPTRQPWSPPSTAGKGFARGRDLAWQGLRASSDIGLAASEELTWPLAAHAVALADKRPRIAWEVLYGGERSGTIRRGATQIDSWRPERSISR